MKNAEDVTHSLNCIDLFAGAGGFSLAARLAGLSVRLAIENNGHAVSTYRRNICAGQPLPVLKCEDISTLCPESLNSEIYGEGESCDLLLGGPPCQGFSSHRLHDSGVSDARNDLIHVYFKFVKAFRPSVFLMENVPGMLWPRHATYLERFYLEGGQAGYRLCQPKILDARDYGLPQRRKRVFILGIREDVGVLADNWWPEPSHGSKAAREVNPALKPWNNCKSAFAPAPPNDVNDVHMNHGEALRAAFEQTPANGGRRKDSGRTLPCHVEHDGHKDVYGRIDPSQPAPTMTTACINPSKGRFLHPLEHHGITVRQAARLQTFPDNFVFDGGLISAGQQIGNAVPVMLGKVLIEHLIPTLVKSPQRVWSVSAKDENMIRKLVN